MSKSKTSKFRSGLEERIAKQLEDLGVEYDYETEVIRYKKPERLSRYTPDFILPNKIYIEGKGQFLTADRRKHRLIREQFGDKYDIRFVFSNPYQRLNKGAKSTYADWCDYYGFLFAKEVIPHDWIKEKKKKICLNKVL